MGYITRNDHERTHVGSEPIVACLHLISTFKDVIELFVPIMHVQRHTVARHRGHFTDAVRALRLGAPDAYRRAALGVVFQRRNKNGCSFGLHVLPPRDVSPAAERLAVQRPGSERRRGPGPSATAGSAAFDDISERGVILRRENTHVARPDGRTKNRRSGLRGLSQMELDESVLGSVWLPGLAEEVPPLPVD